MPCKGAVPDEFKELVGSDNSFKYKVVRPVGQGSFSTVWLLTEVSSGRLVVGKFMNTTSMSSKNRNFAVAEGKNASLCSHPNIIEFIEMQERNGQLMLIFEYADAGDLCVQLDARAPTRFFREGEILLILTQVSLAVHHLHEKNMMHRDLKAPNVFLTTSGLIKLGDFGFSRQYETSLTSDVGTTFCGTPYYLAPELWKQAPYSSKADIWSLGVILYELMTLRKPFKGQTMKDLIRKVVAGAYDPPDATLYSPSLLGLCARMLTVDPASRPTIKEVLQSDVVFQGGLVALQKNVPRLSGVKENVRKAVVEHIESLIREFSIT